MIRRIQVVVVLMIAVLVIAESCRAKVYQNEEFGIELQIPKGVFLCPRPLGEHDDGAMLLLRAVHRNSCADILDSYERTRYVGIFAEYNVLWDSGHLPDFLKEMCAGVPKGPCGKPPDGLDLPGLASFAGRVDHPDGWTYIIVVTEATPSTDPTAPSIYYDITLHTNKQHLQRDIAVLRTVLGTIRINPK